MAVNYTLTKYADTSDPSCAKTDTNTLSLVLYSDGQVKTSSGTKIDKVSIEFNHTSGSYPADATFTLTLEDPDGKKVSPILVTTTSADVAEFRLARISTSGTTPYYTLSFSLPSVDSETTYKLNHTSGTPPPKLKITVKRQPNFSAAAVPSCA